MTTGRRDDPRASFGMDRAKVLNWIYGFFLRDGLWVINWDGDIWKLTFQISTSCSTLGLMWTWWWINVYEVFCLKFFFYSVQKFLLEFSRYSSWRCYGNSCQSSCGDSCRGSWSFIQEFWQGSLDGSLAGIPPDFPPEFKSSSMKFSQIFFKPYPLRCVRGSIQVLLVDFFKFLQGLFLELLQGLRPYGNNF